jgi:hypothetical protein
MDKDLNRMYFLFVMILVSIQIYYRKRNLKHFLILMMAIQIFSSIPFLIKNDEKNRVSRLNFKSLLEVQKNDMPERRSKFEKPIEGMNQYLNALSVVLRSSTHEYLCNDNLKGQTVSKEVEMFFNKIMNYNFFEMKNFLAGIQTKEDLYKSNSELFFKIFGCSDSILRFSDSLIITNNIESTVELLKVHSPGQDIITDFLEKNFHKQILYSEDYSLSSIKVDSFSANELRFRVNIQNVEGRYLIYSDAYHPNWHVYIDGIESNLLRANLAFKSAFLPSGNHIIKFQFGGLRDRIKLLLPFILFLSSVILFFIIKE